MRPAAVLVLVVIASLVISPASGADIEVDPTVGGFLAGATDRLTDPETGPVAGSVRGASHPQVPTQSAAPCLGDCVVDIDCATDAKAGLLDGNLMLCTGTTASPSADPTPSRDDVVSAFRQVDLPASTLVVQPPGGRTLVNFDTNFLTPVRPFVATLDLLGYPVELSIRPASYAWHFGDDTAMTTTTPGAEYPNLEVTHRYLRKGKVAARVDVTWTADYRIGGGAWQPVGETVTMPGQPVELRVLSATPVLVGH